MGGKEVFTNGSDLQMVQIQIANKIKWFQIDTSNVKKKKKSEEENSPSPLPLIQMAIHNENGFA